jgi:hypothetical protein
MAKRFFDTELIEKDWYLELNLAEREIVRLAMAKCDCVGVWKPSRRIAEAIAGPVDIDAIPNKTEGNIEIMPGGKWFIVDFCAFQYGKLTPTCAPHKKYISLLIEYGLYERVLKTFERVIEKPVRLQEEEEEEEEEISSLSISSLNSLEPKVSNGSNRINMHIGSWNANDNLPHFRFTSVNMKPEDLSLALRTMSAYSDDEIFCAITNYAKILSDIDMDPFPVYATFAGFMAGGVEKYADDAKPFDRCRKKQGVDYDEQRRQEARAHLRKIQGEGDET